MRTILSIENSFIKRLKEALHHPLPGFEAQMEMASEFRARRLAHADIPADAVESSVLILLYPSQNKLHTVFIQRQTYDGVHSGQISFPGGRMEPTDEDSMQTALREAHEEVNVDPGHVDVLGSLTSLYIPPSNFVVYPWVGFSNAKPNFIAQQSEVAGIIDVDMEFLFNPKLRKRKIIHVRNSQIDAPYFDVDGNIIWGATAMILNELKVVIERMN